MSTKLKLLPVLIMLLAGAITSVITYILKYETSTMLWILAGVLLLFYILGTIVQKIIHRFEEQIEEEEEQRAREEGVVVEKDAKEIEAGQTGESSSENGEAAESEQKEGDEAGFEEEN